MSISNDERFLEEIRNLLKQSKQLVKTSINLAVVYINYEIGRRIVEQEQKGKDRAEYGEQLIKKLSKSLTKEFKKGYSVQNLKNIKQFYMVYSKDTPQEIDNVIFNKNQKSQSLVSQFDIVQNDGKEKVSSIQYGLAENVLKENNFVIFNKNQKSQAVLSQFDIVPSNTRRFCLPWAHYVILMRIKDPLERRFYEIEAYQNGWSQRELIRQYDSALYQRLALSRSKDKVLELSLRGQVIEKPEDVIKDPYVLEFLDLKEDSSYSEKDLETRIINKLQDFLLELGKGFTFVARQARLTFDENHFYPDLVFYNRILRCFVIIDLKIGSLKHQDIGQMQMYVNYYDRNVKLDDENKTIGILLCREKNDAVIQMTLPEDNKQIFASKYEMILPSKEEFMKIIKD